MTETSSAEAGAHNATIKIEEAAEDRESLEVEDSPDGLEQ